MKAILTEYKPCTATGPARIIAKTFDQRVTLTEGEFDESNDHHTQAALKLVKKMGWRGKLVRNDFGAGRSVFCWTESRLQETGQVIQTAKQIDTDTEPEAYIDYLNRVDAELERLYGITSNDVNLATIAAAQEEGETPEECARWIGRKYDLDEKEAK